MKRTINNKHVTSLAKKRTLFLFGCFLIIFSSWNVKAPIQIQQTADSVPPPYFPSFKMSSQDVNTYIVKSNNVNKLIFRFVMNGMVVDNNMKLVCYYAKDQVDHGQDDGNPIVLDRDTQAPQGMDVISTQAYILGNNYLKVKVLKEYLSKLRLPANFSYLRFTPKVIVTSNNILLQVQACNSTGQVLETLTTFLPKYHPFSATYTSTDGIATNPSPPAKPGED